MAEARARCRIRARAAGDHRSGSSRGHSEEQRQLKRAKTGIHFVKHGIITIGVYTVNGATPSPLPTPLSITIATSPDCTTGGSGTSCTITVTVPVANSVVLQLLSYDATGGLLGSALIGPINTTLSTIPTQSVSVGGVPETILLSPSGLAAGDDGASHSVTFTVAAQDASGNTILQPGNYPNPIALTITGDTNGALSLSTASVPSPGPSRTEPRR